MKILLIDPPEGDGSRNYLKKIQFCLPSLGLAYFASVLQKEGYDVYILDCTAERVSLDIIEDKIRSYGSIDFIVFTASTLTFKNAIVIAKICKKIFPPIRILFKGVHSRVLPDEVLSYNFVDYVIRDEGEETIKELISGKSLSKILDLSYKKKGIIVHNKPRLLTKNLDTIPYPAYHLLPMKKYRPFVGTYRKIPAVNVITTRGCAGKCTFCHKVFVGAPRGRSAKNVIEEIKLLQKRYGAKEIIFFDDNFATFKRNVNELCDIILREKIDIAWTCATRIDSVDREMLKKMKAAGCHLVHFGVESGDERILNSIKKNISLEQVKKTIQSAKELGLDTRASFMFGNPGETEETIKKTLDFAINLDLDMAVFVITIAYPGTEIYKWAKKKGYILSENWLERKRVWGRTLYHYNTPTVVMKLPTIDNSTLWKYRCLARKRFYMRPKIVFRRLRRIKTISQLMQDMRYAWDIITS